MTPFAAVVRGYLAAMQGRFRSFPRDYLVFDLETTGIDLKEDLILQIGHCLVLGGEPVDTADFVLDWTARPGIDAGWLGKRIERTREFVEYDKDGRPSGRHYRFSPERLRQEGSDPLAILRFYHDWLQELRGERLFLVAHNGYHFDCCLLERHFHQFLASPFVFGDWEVFDTGMVVKAMQMNLPFWRGETPRSFSRRAYGQRLRGVRWALDTFCVPHFNLDKKHNLQAGDAHEAAWDVHVTHLLFQECLQAANSAVPA
jgi:DNA polymerase III epsilon subunit-like protein